jgi:hypothetical protein
MTTDKKTENKRKRMTLGQVAHKKVLKAIANYYWCLARPELEINPKSFAEHELWEDKAINTLAFDELKTWFEKKGIKDNEND